MKITIEHYGKIYTMEWAHEDVNLPEFFQSVCNMLVALGWSIETINEMFEDTLEGNRSPLGWEVHP